MQLKTSKNLIIVFLLFALFPYIKILPVISDVQPNALIVGVAIIGVNLLRSIGQNIAVSIYGVVAIALCLVPVDGYYYDNYSILRGLGSVLSFIVCVLAWNEIDGGDLQKIVTNRFVACVLIIYLIGGLGQMYLNPDLLVPILSRPNGYGGVGGRGVESFTAEPTYLAIQMVLIMRFAFVVLKGLLSAINLFLGLLIILIISKSTSVIISGLIGLVFMCIAMLLNRKSGKGAILILLISTILVVVVAGNYIVASGNLQSEIRVLRIVEGLLKDGINGLSVNDYSVADRLKHIEVSFMLSIRDWLIPHGYGDFYANYNSFQSKFLVDDRIYVTFNDRIMSGYGGALFEFGWFGLVPIYLISKNLISSKGYARGFWFVTISLLLIQSVPLSNPMVAFLASRHSGAKKRTND
jgi:hypothetical protein